MLLNDLDLNKLNTFRAVVESGGIGKAGRHLGRTSSAVSQSITALEAALECKLFDRVGKQLILTRGGQELHAAVAGYERLLSRTLESLRGAAEEARGVVRIGLFLGFPRQKARALLQEFGRLHPRASVRVVYAPEQELERRLRKNRLDYVFSFRPRPAFSELASTRLFAQELVLVAGPGFFERGFTLEELEATPIVDYYQSDPLIVRWLAHHFRSHAPEPRVRFWAATTDLVLDLVIGGAGAGVLPRHFARSSVGSRHVKEVGPKGKPLVSHVWLTEPRGAYRDATLRAFREVVLRALRGTSRGRSE